MTLLLIVLAHLGWPSAAGVCPAKVPPPYHCKVEAPAPLPPWLK